MFYYTADNANRLFVESVQGLLRYGETKVPRGLKTIELSPVMLCLTNPNNRYLFHPKRNLNPYAIISELVWIVSGSGDILFPSLFNKQLLFYSDSFTELISSGAVVVKDGMIVDFDEKIINGLKFNAPYGERIRKAGVQKIDQLMNVARELQKDPDSRRAVIVLGNPDLDRLDMTTADRPCNFALIFKVTFGKLNLTVINRSNDIMLGLFNVNIPIFTMIQELIALKLSIPVGNYYHMTNSFHLYTEHKLTNNMGITTDHWPTLKKEILRCEVLHDMKSTYDISDTLFQNSEFLSEAGYLKFKLLDYYRGYDRNDEQSGKFVYLYDYLKCYLDYRKDKSPAKLVRSFTMNDVSNFNVDLAILAYMFYCGLKNKTALELDSRLNRVYGLVNYLFESMK